MKLSVKNIEKRTKIYSIAVTYLFAVAALALVIGIFNSVADGNDTATVVLLSIGGCLLPLSALVVVLVDIQSLLLNLNNGKELYFADNEKE